MGRAQQPVLGGYSDYEPRLRAIAGSDRPDLTGRLLTAEERLADTRRILAGLQVKQPRNVHRPPGPRGPGFVFGIATGRVSPFELVLTMAEHGPVSYAHPFGAHVYVISDPELIHEVFVQQAAKLHKGQALQATRVFLGNGILNSEGAEHRYNRRLVQPAFSRTRLDDYARQMVAGADRTSAAWSQRVADGDTEISVVEEMSALTLDVVGRTLFDADLSADSAIVSGALDNVLDAFNRMLTPSGMLFTSFPSPMRSRLLAGVEALDEIVMPLIERKRRELDLGGDPRDALAMLIRARDPETGAELSDQQLRDEVVTLLLAGHETTAMLLSWTCLELSRHPEILRGLLEEWEAVDIRSEPSLSDVALLHRTNAVIAESLRLHPPAWAVGRTAMADITAGDYEIPEGSTLLASQYVMHQHPDHWSDPESFAPDRWLDPAGVYDERNPGQPRGAWFPFGFGARKCIGDRFALAEAALVLARLGRRWHIVPTAPGEVGPDPAVTLRPSTGIRARIRPRTPGGPPPKPNATV